jgi:hypothetical protein
MNRLKLFILIEVLDLKFVSYLGFGHWKLKIPHMRDFLVPRIPTQSGYGL